MPRFKWNKNKVNFASGYLTQKGGDRVQIASQFDSASWLKYNCTVSANVVTAPDGTLTADKFVTNNINEFQFVYFNRQVVTSGKITLVCYMKAAEHSTGMITQANQWGASFELLFGGTANLVGAFTADHTCSITDIGGGWYKCSITNNNASTAHVSTRISSNDTAIVPGVGNGIDGIYIWGAHIIYSPYTDFDITFSAAAGGVVSPTGTIRTGYGSNVITTITPDAGKFCSTIVKDGIQADLPYPGFTSVTLEHIIQIGRYCNFYFADNP